MSETKLLLKGLQTYAYRKRGWCLASKALLRAALFSPICCRIGNDVLMSARHLDSSTEFLLRSEEPVNQDLCHSHITTADLSLRARLVSCFGIKQREPSLQLAISYHLSFRVYNTQGKAQSIRSFARHSFQAHARLASLALINFEISRVYPCC